MEDTQRAETSESTEENWYGTTKTKAESPGPTLYIMDSSLLLTWNLWAY